MTLPHPFLPTNPSLWSLSRILDNARRWLDHCDTQEDYDMIDAFIVELEIRLNEMTEATDFLSRCYSHEQQTD